MVRFIFNSINHSNNTCKNILRVKLLSVNSTFAANYQYLSYKYGLIEADWFTPLGHLLGKVKKKILLLHPHPVLCGIPGASPGFERGGPRNFFFQIWEFACREATFAMRIARGVRGHAPPRKFF